MFESIFSSLLGKYPVLEFIVATMIVLGGLYTIWRGERQKRDRAATLEQNPENRYITELDLARFEADLDERLAEKRRDLYARIEVLGTRMTVCETQLNILMSRRRS